jgi:ribosome assembly protein YihI (activator of Der GTPase)
MGLRKQLTTVAAPEADDAAAAAAARTGSSSESKDGSKTKKRKAVHSKDGGDHGGSIDKKETESRVTNMGSSTGFPSPLMVAPRQKKKKKLLILDLNGLLADINQDNHNAHLSHGKFRGKLGKVTDNFSALGQIFFFCLYIIAIHL